MEFEDAEYFYQQEYGYHYTGGSYVCPKCFSDDAVKQYIEFSASKTMCSYCGSQSPKPNSTFLGDVIEFIMQGIMQEYEEYIDIDHEDYEYYEYEYEYKHVYHEADSYSTTDIFNREIAPIIISKNNRLVQDIKNSLDNKKWCLVNSSISPSHDSLVYDWQLFSTQVKHHTRYVFFKIGSKILDNIAKIIMETPLTSILSKGQTIWRVRVHEPDIICDDYKSCGPPPPKLLKYSNRMSPAGISMFYGALDEKTAILEIMDKGKGNITTISKWELNHELRFLNLSNIPAVPSLFDSYKHEYRTNIKFLRSFSQEISKPTHKDGFEHVEYVPTQVFTEYIRHLYKDNDKYSFDGILYPSSMKGGHTNCVVFCDQSKCCDNEWDLFAYPNKPKLLVLVKCTDISNNSLASYLTTLNDT